jgi:cytochrome c oxidase subunit II
MLRSKRLPTLRAGLRRLSAAALAIVAMLRFGARACAEQPHDWQIGMLPPATPVEARLEAFNNELTVIIGLITVFVLGLLLYVIIRFDGRRHPVPTRTTHNSVVEILWTVIPVVILIVIAVPSFKLMYYMADVPKDAAMTIDITGHQWYWSYKYPQQGGLAFDSIIVPQADLKPGQPRLLTVNNPLVVPVDTDIRILVTSTDVIHSWFMPAFGVQEYAMPGRENEAWFRVEHPGIYRGQCNQLCGLNHAFMPINVVAMTKAGFQRWLVGAKKQFATAATTVRVASTGGSSAVVRPVSTGN